MELLGKLVAAAPEVAELLLLGSFVRTFQKAAAVVKNYFQIAFAGSVALVEKAVEDLHE